MGAEIGATTSMFPYNERMARYLHATERGDIAKIADQYKHLLTGDEGAEYDEVCTFPGVNILSKCFTYTHFFLLRYLSEYLGDSWHTLAKFIYNYIVVFLAVVSRMFFSWR